MPAAAYTIPGGLNSVIQTEVIQAILLIFGSILLTYYAFDQVGGWNGMIAGLNEYATQGKLMNSDLKNAREVLSMVRPLGDEFMSWRGLLLGAPILGFYFWANNQFMVQRVLGAKNVNHGRWGALFAGFLKLPVIFIMVLPGTCAILLFSDLDLTAINYVLPDGSVCANLRDCPNATYPVLLFQLLPAGVLGLVLAGLLAAMMSSVSATFNSASTLITMDFVKQLRPNMSSEQLVRVGQISTLILVILASAWAPMIERANSLWEYLQVVLAYIAPPVAATFILGLFWKRANGTGSIASLLFGFAFAIFGLFALIAVNVYEGNAESTAGFGPGKPMYDMLASFDSIHFLDRTVILFLLCLLINYVVSLVTAPPPVDKVANYTWSVRLFKEETKELKGLPWYQNYRILAIFLLIITAVVVGMFI